MSNDVVSWAANAINAYSKTEPAPKPPGLLLQGGRKLLSVAKAMCASVASLGKVLLMQWWALIAMTTQFAAHYRMWCAHSWTASMSCWDHTAM